MHLPGSGQEVVAGSCKHTEVPCSMKGYDLLDYLKDDWKERERERKKERKMGRREEIRN
jgi:hypothetical protein